MAQNKARDSPEMLLALLTQREELRRGTADIKLLLIFFCSYAFDLSSDLEEYKAPQVDLRELLKVLTLTLIGNYI